MAHFMQWVVKAVIVFLCGVFFGLSAFGCAKEPTPDPVNAPLTEVQQRTLDTGRGEEAKYGYNPPKATTWDKVDNAYRGAKSTVDKAAVTTGRLIATFFFHLLLWVVPFLVIVFIPGILSGEAEMALEGAVLIVAGIALLAGNWVGELGLSHWVWICLILPGAILILARFFVKEGAWKLAVVFGGQTVMTMLAIFGVLDTCMSALIHGSYIALAVVGIILYGIFHGDKDEAGSPAESHA